MSFNEVIANRTIFKEILNISSTSSLAKLHTINKDLADYTSMVLKSEYNIRKNIMKFIGKNDKTLFDIMRKCKAEINGTFLIGILRRSPESNLQMNISCRCRSSNEDNFHRDDNISKCPMYSYLCHTWSTSEVKLEIYWSKESTSDYRLGFHRFLSGESNNPIEHILPEYKNNVPNFEHAFHGDVIVTKLTKDNKTIFLYHDYNNRFRTILSNYNHYKLKWNTNKDRSFMVNFPLCNINGYILTHHIKDVHKPHDRNVVENGYNFVEINTIIRYLQLLSKILLVNSDIAKHGGSFKDWYKPNVEPRLTSMNISLEDTDISSVAILNRAIIDITKLIVDLYDINMNEEKEKGVPNDKIAKFYAKKLLYITSQIIYTDNPIYNELMMGVFFDIQRRSMDIGYLEYIYMNKDSVTRILKEVTYLVYKDMIIGCILMMLTDKTELYSSFNHYNFPNLPYIN